MIRKISVFLVSAFLLSCEWNEISLPENLPTCVESLTFTTHPPLEIWRYRYDGKTVYFALSDCCDFPNPVYDQNCKMICAPSGGFSGKGDGKCPDFFDKAKDGVMVWKKD